MLWCASLFFHHSRSLTVTTSSRTCTMMDDVIWKINSADQVQACMTMVSSIFNLPISLLILISSMLLWSILYIFPLESNCMRFHCLGCSFLHSLSYNLFLISSDQCYIYHSTHSFFCLSSTTNFLLYLLVADRLYIRHISFLTLSSYHVCSAAHLLVVLLFSFLPCISSSALPYSHNYNIHCLPLLL